MKHVKATPAGAKILWLSASILVQVQGKDGTSSSLTNLHLPQVRFIIPTLHLPTIGAASTLLLQISLVCGFAGFCCTLGTNLRDRRPHLYPIHSIAAPGSTAPDTTPPLPAAPSRLFAGNRHGLFLPHPLTAPPPPSACAARQVGQARAAPRSKSSPRNKSGEGAFSQAREVGGRETRSCLPFATLLITLPAHERASMSLS